MSFFFFKIFIEKDNAVIFGSLGAFMGAFFAYLFIRIATALDKNYQRIQNHRNSMVKFERVIMKMNGLISDNLFVIDDFTGVVNNAIQNKIKMIYFNKLHPIDISEYSTLDLQNIDLINDIESFYFDMRRTNSDLETINTMLQEYRTAVIDDKVDLETYLFNLGRLTEQLSMVKAFLLELSEDTITLQSKIRVMLKGSEPFLGWLLKHTTKHHYTQTQRNDFDKESKKVKNEMEENLIKNRQRLERLSKEPKK
jgi:hypothetical protein